MKRDKKGKKPSAGRQPAPSGRGESEFYHIRPDGPKSGTVFVYNGSFHVHIPFDAARRAGMKLPKKPSILCLTLFLLLFGVNGFLRIGIIDPITAGMAIAAAVFFLIGK